MSHRCCTLLLYLALPALAQTPAPDTGRDPTDWPPALRGALAAATAASQAGETAPATVIHQVVLVDGRAYVVQRGRRLAVGDMLDGARIERITEQAVWLREGGKRRREPLYGGVEKRLPPSTPAAQKSKEKQP